VTQADVDHRSVTNTAYAKSGNTQSAPDSVTIPATIPPPPPPPVADLGINKTGPSIAKPGDTVTYVLTVTNTGGPTSGFTVNDQMPAGLTATSISGSGFTCTLATATCTYPGTLPGGGTAVITVVAVISPSFTGTSLTNTAVVSPTDATPGDNTSTFTTPIAPPGNLGVSKTGPASASRGDELVYAIDVTNTTGDPATGFTVTDVLPDGLLPSLATGDGFGCVVTGQTITCTYAGTLAVGAKASIIVRALLDSTYRGNTVVNTAVLAPGRPDSDPTDNTSTATTTVVPLPLTGGGGGPVQAPPSPTPAPVGGGGALPFTGAPATSMLQGGVALLLLGLFLALVTRRRRHAAE
jgi:uncharacterized repeat protein (TIGR01451 family)